ncbi:MAG: hypothetical protein AAF735_08475 [Myxococcota bacterium]
MLEKDWNQLSHQDKAYVHALETRVQKVELLSDEEQRIFDQFHEQKQSAVRDRKWRWLMFLFLAPLILSYHLCGWDKDSSNEAWQRSKPSSTDEIVFERRWRDETISPGVTSWKRELESIYERSAEEESAPERDRTPDSGSSNAAPR